VLKGKYLISYHNKMMKRIFVILLFVTFFSSVSFSFFDFKEVSPDILISNLNEMTNIYRGNLSVYSKYLYEFMSNTYGIYGGEFYITINNTNISINFKSTNTNFTLKALPVPLQEILDVAFNLKYKLSEFSKVYLADYGKVKIFKLPFKKGKNYFYVYFSNGKIERIDLWMKESEEILIWSSLLAFDPDKENNLYFLSSALVNIGASQFYKFDFRRLKN
jgi:hypothetical protein